MLAMFVMVMLPIANAAQHAGQPELMHDPVIVEFSRVLLKKAASERHHEQGAFVVRTPDGMLYFVAWPPSAESDILRWHGRFPDGTVAIVHTHPPSLPEASKLDMRAARNARIPIYVITPATIAKTTGDASQVVFEW
jgi:proteasome lid subunit RPN8/RPN11